MLRVRVRSVVLCVFKFLYLVALATLFAWCLKGYAHACWRYGGLWSGEWWLDPLRSSLGNPLVVLECGIGDSRLVVRLLRTYTEPEARDLQVVVELELIGGESTRMEVRKRAILGSFISLEFPLSFGVRQVVSYRVEVYLSGRLVAARQEV